MMGIAKYIQVYKTHITSPHSINQKTLTMIILGKVNLGVAKVKAIAIRKTMIILVTPSHDLTKKPIT